MEQLSPPHTPETPNGRRDTKGFLSSNSCLGGSCRVPLKKRKHVLADSYREAEAGTPHADTRLAPPPLTYSPNGLSSLNSPPQTPPTETAAYGSKSETNRYVPDHANPNPNEFSGIKCAPGYETQNCDLRADATRRTGAINSENTSRIVLAHEGDRSESVINGEISSSYYVASSTSRSPSLPVQPSYESTLHQEHSSYAYNRTTYEGNVTASAYSPDRITYYESITSAYKDYRKVKDDSTTHLHSYRSSLPSDRQYDNYQTAAVEPPRAQACPKSYQPEMHYAGQSKAVDQQPPSVNATAEYSSLVPSSSTVYLDPRTHGSSQPDKYVSCRPESAPQPYTREDPPRYRYHSQNSDFNAGSMPSRSSISTDSHAGFYAESVCRPPSRCYTNLDHGQSNFEGSTVASSHVSPNLSDSLKNFLPSNLLSHEPAAASTSKKPKKSKKYSYFINGKLLDDVASVANSLSKQDSDSNGRVHSKNVAELSEVFNELPSSERVNPDFQASQSHEVSEEEYCLMPLAGSSRLPATNQLTGVTGRLSAVNTEQPMASAGGTMRKKKPRCSLCLNHGKSVDLKGHKDVCEYKSCICESCIITKQRREAYKIQQNLNRRQDRERLLFDAEDGSSSQ